MRGGRHWFLCVVGFVATFALIFLLVDENYVSSSWSQIIAPRNSTSENSSWEDHSPIQRERPSQNPISYQSSSDASAGNQQNLEEQDSTFHWKDVISDPKSKGLNGSGVGENSSWLLSSKAENASRETQPSTSASPGCETCRLENLCQECRTKSMARGLTCFDRLRRYLNGNMTLEMAQEIVSREFGGACSTCNLSTCADRLPSIPETETALFYNVYLPPNNTEHGLDIVREQLQARQYSSLRDSSLLYVQIGNTTASFPPCHACSSIQTVESGDEVLTLRALHRYCVDNPDHRVAYIHNKGSFTDTVNNQRLRQVLTKGVFSHECAGMPSNTTCDVCSAQFSAFPFHSTPGNMFLADCTYVCKLIPPKRFVIRKAQVYQEAQNDSNFVGMMPAYQFGRKSWVGLGRYAMEHWIYSHPSVRPCDVYRDGAFSYERPPRSIDWVPSRRPAPAYTRSEVAMEFHPWFLLPGRLYEWRKLYSVAPPDDSWVWKFYGDDRRYNSTR